MGLHGYLIGGIYDGSPSHVFCEEGRLCLAWPGLAWQPVAACTTRALPGQLQLALSEPFGP